MRNRSARATPGWSMFRIAGTSLGTALAIATTGITLTGVWLSGARDPSCGSSDCDQGVALLAMFFGMVSLASGAVAGAIVGGVLATRQQPTETRSGVSRRAATAAVLPLALVLLYLYAVT